MAQLSIWEKQRHFSNKDFTCSIGKHDVIYITFRNNSWKRFTTSEKIAVYVGQSGALKFDDPMNHRGVILKLKKGNGSQKVAETTRYLQISGKAWPRILEVIRRTAGSYNMTQTEEPEPLKPEPVEEGESRTVQTAPAPEINQEQPAPFGDYLQALINQAVQEAFKSYTRNEESAAYKKGYDEGYRKGYETAKNDKWDLI